jgi:hypothetical protein
MERPLSASVTNELCQAERAEHASVLRQPFYSISTTSPMEFTSTSLTLPFFALPRIS